MYEISSHNAAIMVLVISLLLLCCAKVGRLPFVSLHMHYLTACIVSDDCTMHGVRAWGRLRMHYVDNTLG